MDDVNEGAGPSHGSRAVSMQARGSMPESHSAKMRRVQSLAVVRGPARAKSSKKSSFPPFGPTKCRPRGRRTRRDGRVSPDGVGWKGPVWRLAAAIFEQLDLSGAPLGIGNA